MTAAKNLASAHQAGEHRLLRLNRGPEGRRGPESAAAPERRTRLRHPEQAAAAADTRIARDTASIERQRKTFTTLVRQAFDRDERLGYPKLFVEMARKRGDRRPRAELDREYRDRWAAHFNSQLPVLCPGCAFTVGVNQRGVITPVHAHETMPVGNKSVPAAQSAPTAREPADRTPGDAERQRRRSIPGPNTVDAAPHPPRGSRPPTGKSTPDNRTPRREAASIVPATPDDMVSLGFIKSDPPGTVFKSFDDCIEISRGVFELLTREGGAVPRVTARLDNGRLAAFALEHQGHQAGLDKAVPPAAKTLISAAVGKPISAEGLRVLTRNVLNELNEALTTTRTELLTRLTRGNRFLVGGSSVDDGTDNPVYLSMYVESLRGIDPAVAEQMARHFEGKPPRLVLKTDADGKPQRLWLAGGARAEAEPVLDAILARYAGLPLDGAMVKAIGDEAGRVLQETVASPDTRLMNALSIDNGYSIAGPRILAREILADAKFATADACRRANGDASPSLQLAFTQEGRILQTRFVLPNGNKANVPPSVVQRVRQQQGVQTAASLKTLAKALTTLLDDYFGASAAWADDASPPTAPADWQTRPEAEWEAPATPDAMVRDHGFWNAEPPGTVCASLSDFYLGSQEKLAASAGSSATIRVRLEGGLLTSFSLRKRDDSVIDHLLPPAATSRIAEAVGKPISADGLRRLAGAVADGVVDSSAT